jgi:hypothetical protein
MLVLLVADAKILAVKAGTSTDPACLDSGPFLCPQLPLLFAEGIDIREYIDG